MKTDYRCLFSISIISPQPSNTTQICTEQRIEPINQTSESLLNRLQMITRIHSLSTGTERTILSFNSETFSNNAAKNGTARSPARPSQRPTTCESNFTNSTQPCPWESCLSDTERTGGKGRYVRPQLTTERNGRNFAIAYHQPLCGVFICRKSATVSGTALGKQNIKSHQV